MPEGFTGSPRIPPAGEVAPMPFFHNIAGQDDLAGIFTFSATTPSSTRFSFSRSPSPRPAQQPARNSRKRHRPLADVDGDTSGRVMKKKRRLRLRLITSRLSRPFSAPPTHIVDRGPSKIAVWVKQKKLGQNLLRKAAIMNRIRKHMAEGRGVKAPTLIKQYDTITPAQLPRRPFIPLPPSPLGLSNYDVLDMEDELRNECCDDDEGPLVYSDFNFLEPVEPDSSDFGSFPQPRRPPSPPDEKEVELMLEKQRQKELCFVTFA
ncbi:hypothetical protein GP486_008396 [Trichoglossum hirsutum]|uniref:Uncharacterized protein n=1 Tax=Trichoglossum hirsutum TaxID=265104 RepID=A0A9P8L6D0_9PEZI|nr:hypothetical protein GP486_008396 [Trichoglossum hirsutum]